MAPALSDDQLLLQRFHRHVRERGDAPYLVQPTGGGQVTTYTFAQVAEQAKSVV